MGVERLIEEYQDALDNLELASELSSSVREVVDAVDLVISILTQIFCAGGLEMHCLPAFAESIQLHIENRISNAEASKARILETEEGSPSDGEDAEEAIDEARGEALHLAGTLGSIAFLFFDGGS